MLKSKEIVPNVRERYYRRVCDYMVGTGWVSEWDFGPDGEVTWHNVTEVVLGNRGKGEAGVRLGEFVIQFVPGTDGKRTELMEVERMFELVFHERGVHVILFYGTRWKLKPSGREFEVYEFNVRMDKLAPWVWSEHDVGFKAFRIHLHRFLCLFFFLVLCFLVFGFECLVLLARFRVMETDDLFVHRWVGDTIRGIMGNNDERQLRQFCHWVIKCNAHRDLTFACRECLEKYLFRRDDEQMVDPEKTPANAFQHFFGE